jgi:hypothetical protein
MARAHVYLSSFLSAVFIPLKEEVLNKFGPAGAPTQISELWNAVRFALLTTLFVHADSDGGVCSTCYSQTDSPDPPVHPARHAAVSRRPTRSEHKHGQSLSPAQDANSDNIFLTFKRTVLWSPDFEAFRPDWWFEPALLDKVLFIPKGTGEIMAVP